jgi:aminoglycoside phosphotransferase family enzyme/predicted kinase
MNNLQQETVEFLADPGSYVPRPEKVEWRETHGSIVFLAGDRAFKLKRAVRYPYLDYSTPEARKTMCERELEINRRIAPELYLEVRAIIRDTHGRLCFGPADTSSGAVDWVVVMKRFDESALVAEMRRLGPITPQLMRRLGETIADFHAGAEVVRSFGGAAGIGAVIDENAALLRKCAEHSPDADRIERLESVTRTAFARLGPLLDARRDAGQVRRCHGDLHLNNICVLGGRPVLFDAIEFNDDFSCIDVFYDLAFPLMDMLRTGMGACANTLLNRYLEKTADYEGLAAFPLFLSCRAAIAAHVAVSRARETGKPEDAARARAGFSEMVALATGCLDRSRPYLIAVGGLSGTGKSTLAYGLAPSIPPSPGAIVLRTDTLRKRLLGVPETERLHASAYTAAMHDRIYADLASLAAVILAAGLSVIVDAVLGEPEHRDAMARVAADAGVAFAGLWLDAPVAALEERIIARRCDASDATVDVLHRQFANVIAPTGWLRVDAARSAAATLEHARRLLTPILFL